MTDVTFCMSRCHLLHVPVTFCMSRHRKKRRNDGCHLLHVLENASPEIEIDLATLRGEWLSQDEATIELGSAEGWADLAQRISALVNPNQNGVNA